LNANVTKVEEEVVVVVVSQLLQQFVTCSSAP
jgi:hypothetical protein